MLFIGPVIAGKAVEYCREREQRHAAVTQGVKGFAGLLPRLSANHDHGG
jgi:hypothetical protein